MRTEKTREQLIEENPQLQQVDPAKYDGRKVAAKNIRTELKASFPGIKFSIRGESFAGSDSIIIKSVDVRKNGIEVVFESKPESEVLNYLKSKGFRWSKFSKLWFRRYSESFESELKGLRPRFKGWI